MKLSIKFPENLLTHSLLEQRLIPCICKIATEFEIEFLDPLPEAAGTVLEWDRAELEKRAIGGVGGQYSHYAHGRVTLKKLILISTKYWILKCFIGFLDGAASWKMVTMRRRGSYGMMNKLKKRGLKKRDKKRGQIYLD